MNYDDKAEGRDRFYTCAACGKTFYIPITTSIEDYVYKYPRRQVHKKRVEAAFCCSWSCLQKIKSEHNLKIAHR